MSQALLVDSNGSQSPYLSDMLFADLLQAMQHRSDRFTAAREVSSTVTRKLLGMPGKPLFSAKTISNATSGVLKRFDRRAHLRYVAEHPSLQG
jgi:transcriptional regulator NrdR family protein